MTSTVYALTGRDPADVVRERLRDIPIAARRLEFAMPGPATVPLSLLRGVLGAALHDCDHAVYETVFAPGTRAPRADSAVPGYVLRRAPSADERSVAVDCVLIGDAVRFAAAFSGAWREAGARGLGVERAPFVLLSDRALDASARPLAPGAHRPDFSLGDVAWPFEEAGTSPCRILFEEPVRILRNGRLVTRPSLSDLVAAGVRRIAAYMPPPRRDAWRAVQASLIGTARQVATGSWTGEAARLRRWSAAQQARVEVHGVRGALDCPRGLGDLWPLFAALMWTHIGKSTVFGLGQPVILPAFPAAPESTGGNGAVMRPADRVPAASRRPRASRGHPIRANRMDEGSRTTAPVAAAGEDVAASSPGGERPSEEHTDTGIGRRQGSESASGPRILVAFVGDASDYTEADYEDADGVRIVRSRFAAVALATAVGVGANDTVVLCHSVQTQVGAQAAAAELTGRIRGLRPMLVEMEPFDAQSQIERLTAPLRSALAAASATEIVLDLTNGPRPVPVLFRAAAALLRLAGRVDRVVTAYAQPLQPKGSRYRLAFLDGVESYVELATRAEVARRAGRLDIVVDEFLAAERRAAAGGHGDLELAKRIRALRRPLEKLGVALQRLDVPAIQDRLGELRRLTATPEVQLDARFRLIDELVRDLLGPLLDALPEDGGGYAEEDGPEIDLHVRLAEWLADHGRIVEAVLVFGEALISAVAVHLERPTRWLEESIRDEASGILNLALDRRGAIAAGASPGDDRQAMAEVRAAAELHGAQRDLRNQLAHAGMRKERTSIDLQQRVTELARRFRQLDAGCWRALIEMFPPFGGRSRPAGGE